MPKQAWSIVKPAASELSQKELLSLVGELYRLSRGNQSFLNARFADQGVAMEELKAIALQVGKARKAVADFCKAVADPAAHADLMLFFLEQGNAFTLGYGDIDAGFYSALVAMARSAGEVICSLPIDLQEPFRERPGEVVRSSSGIGWGYHDDLTDIYASPLWPH